MIILIKNNTLIIFILITFLFSIFLIKTIYYKHQYIALFIIILLSILRYFSKIFDRGIINNTKNIVVFFYYKLYN